MEEIIINNKKILFNEVPDIRNLGTSAFYFIDQDKKYFLKKYVSPAYCDILKREVFFLKLLSKYDCFPKIKKYTKKYIITEYIGVPLSSDNYPVDTIEQCNKILDILKKENIRHWDIKYGELLVSKDNKLFLVDFNWASYNNSWDCNIGLHKTCPPHLYGVYHKFTDKQMFEHLLTHIFNKIIVL